MKVAILSLCLIFGLMLLATRGPLLWDAAGLALADAVTAAPLTAWGECERAHQTGRALLLNENYDAALPYLHTAVTCDDDRWAWFDLGRAQYALGQDEAAAQSWQKANAYGYVARLGATAGQNGDVAEAQRAWQTAVQIDPQQGQAYVQLGRLLQESDPEQARQFYEQALAVNADFAPAYYALANLHLRQFQSAADALPYFEQAHRLAPQNIEYLVVLARQMGGVDPAQAMAYWQKLADLAERQRPLAYHEMGNLYLRQGDAATAVHYRQMAVDLRPENAEFWQGLGQAYETAGCPAEARQAYEQVMTLQPDSRLAQNAKERLAELETAVGACSVTGNR
ncbi:MAG: tetratricopeptide repeat protein [Anaerolineae bacterium]|nr:tetratricopeptide repeat protein [Anaerolineae bacterium]